MDSGASLDSVVDNSLETKPVVSATSPTSLVSAFSERVSPAPDSVVPSVMASAAEEVVPDTGAAPVTAEETVVPTTLADEPAAAVEEAQQPAPVVEEQAAGEGAAPVATEQMDETVMATQTATTQPLTDSLSSDTAAPVPSAEASQAQQDEQAAVTGSAAEAAAEPESIFAQPTAMETDNTAAVDTSTAMDTSNISDMPEPPEMGLGLSMPAATTTAAHAAPVAHAPVPALPLATAPAPAPLAVPKTVGKGKRGPRPVVVPPVASGDLRSPVMGGTPATVRKSAELRNCEQTLRVLQRHKYAWPFNEPVDPVKLNLPDYFTIVKHPMDLSTVRKKLETGQYTSADEFEADVRQIFANCRLYNKPELDIVKMGNTLEALFEERVSQQPRVSRTPRTAALSPADVDATAWSPRSGTTASPITATAKTPRQRKATPKVASARYDDDDVPASPAPAKSARGNPQAAAARLSNEIKAEMASGGNRNLAEYEKKVEQKLAQLSSIMNELRGIASTLDRPSSSKGSKGKRRKHSESDSEDEDDMDNSTQPMSYADKNKLAKKIGRLRETQLPRVVDIVKESMPNLREGEEVEINLEILDTSTLRKLESYVDSCLGEGKHAKKGGRPPKKARLE